MGTAALECPEPELNLRRGLYRLSSEGLLQGRASCLVAMSVLALQGLEGLRSDSSGQAVVSDTSGLVARRELDGCQLKALGVQGLPRPGPSDPSSPSRG